VFAGSAYGHPLLNTTINLISGSFKYRRAAALELEQAAASSPWHGHGQLEATRIKGRRGRGGLES
jgi:hypothetical protein